MLDGSPVRFRPVKYVIFDLDGTILDTESIMHTVFSELLAKYGITLTKEVRSKFLGRLSRDVYEILIKEYDISLSLEEFNEDREELQNKYFKNIQFMPGACELVNWLWDQNIPIAIGTSSTKKDVAVRIADHKDFFKKFHHITTSDEVDRGKPYPDIFLICASKFPLHPNPKEIVVIEDSISGVKAARAAGMQVVWVPESEYTEEQSRLATKTISSLCEFDPKEFGINLIV